MTKNTNLSEKFGVLSCKAFVEAYNLVGT